MLGNGGGRRYVKGRGAGPGRPRVASGIRGLRPDPERGANPWSGVQSRLTSYSQDRDIKKG